MEWYAFLWFFIVGLCIGSFLNVVIYRLPLEISVARGRSFCPRCEHALAAGDLIPLFSFILLRGKCRYCAAPISWRYPLVETLTGVLYGLTFLRFGISWYTLLGLVFLSVLIVAAFIDHDHTFIPDRLHIIILALAVAACFVGPEISLLSRLIGAGAIGGFMLIVALLTHGIGGGDVKLMAASGLLLGWQLNLMAFFLAYILAGLCYGLPYLLKKLPAHTEVPMAPFFAVALAFALLGGEPLLAWYFGLF